MSELLLAYRTRRVDLVTKDEERNLRELLNGKESIELSLRLREPLKVGAVDEEDDAVDLGEVVTPEPASCCLVSGILEGSDGYAPCW